MTDYAHIENADSAKFLGMYLDRGLTWEDHINMICTKVTSVDSDNDLNELTDLLEDDDIISNQTVGPKKTVQVTQEIDIFKEESSQSTVPSQPLKDELNKNSEIHNGETDSSDDEDHKYAAEQKYTDAGRALKQVLNKSSTSTSQFHSDSPTWKSKKTSVQQTQSAAIGIKTAAKDIYSDPFFGIRIITPLISSQSLQEKMTGKTPVSLARLDKYLQSYDKSSDWVIAGVIVSKNIKTSQKGKPYACWTLSDLREGLKTVSIFLFGKAYKDLWKTATHVVVAILNPNPLDNKSSRDIAALSVLNTDQVMIWGQSKDLGTCKARKKNGEPCTSFVNVGQCEFCVYHVKQEYRKFSGRSELQATWGGGLTDLQNKVLGKSEVFYAGKSYAAIPSKPNRKQVTKDKTRLSSLFGACESRFGPESVPGSSRPADRAPSARVQLMKDAARLQTLTGAPATMSDLTYGVEFPLVSSPALPCRSLAGSKPDKKLTQGKTSSVKEHYEETVVQTTPPKPVDLKPKVKRVEHKPSSKTSNATISKPSPSIMKQGGKKQPTKNRFDSLSKIGSNSSVRQKTHNPIKPLFDVSFEFKDEESNKQLNLKMPTKTDCNTQSAPGSSTENGIKMKSVDKLPVDKAYSSGGLHRPTEPCKNNPSKPLNVKKSPTKRESQLNSIQNSTSPVTSPEYRVKRMEDLVHNNNPRLQQFSSISMSVAVPAPAPVRRNYAKENALKYIKANGPIKKEDPNKKKSKEELNLQQERKKRPMEGGKETAGEPKTPLSKRFLELMNMTSIHEDLISEAENSAMDLYFEKHEKKERMEEKMLSTYKLECKAFRCLKCQYKWFSPSELCRTEGHPIKVISAVKRFFQCKQCRNRTVSLEVLPLRPCSNCGQTAWQRAPMIREKKAATVHLSIRGGEQRFVNSVETDTNLNLLVPDG